jgi:N-acetylneuraminate synthase/N,N'-diacetyllegionaminate synthase
VEHLLKKAEYQSVNINDGDDSQYAMLKNLELSHENHFRVNVLPLKEIFNFLTVMWKVRYK